MNTLRLPAPKSAAQPNLRPFRNSQAHASCLSSFPSTDTGARTARPLPQLEPDIPMSLSPTMTAALLALAGAPGPFPRRLGELCQNTLDLLGMPEQLINLTCGIAGKIPASHHEPLLRAAHELVQNAILHGMHLRLLGTIEVHVKAGADGTELDVADDGWGCGPRPVFGSGLRGIAALAERYAGSLRLHRANGWTRARLGLPAQRHAA